MTVAHELDIPAGEARGREQEKRREPAKKMKGKEEGELSVCPCWTTLMPAHPARFYARRSSTQIVKLECL